jgi:hypothetical protein
MIGATFISEPDRSRLAAVQSPEDIDAFEHVDLDRMITLDFVEFLGAAGVAWTDGEPVHFSEEEGAALFKVAAVGLTYALDHADDFPSDCQADLQKLAAFIRKNGVANVYEYATF